KDGVYQGVVIFGDSLKENSQKTMKALRALGVSRLYMLTGDDQKIAQEVADKLELTDCYAELLPQEKMAKLEEIMPTLLPKKKLGYLGDGINDAPVLARADVGMAMGGLGSEAAIEAADVVLMNDDPLKLVTAVMIARRTKELVVQNIVLALALKVVLLGLGALGLIGLWLAVFGDVGVALLCVANAARILKEAGQQATLSSKLAEPMLAKQA
ncbi:MAG: HAD-IC family P-type ATPase, partial [Desulfovibrio sp.]|nr:HAD-IC family P-type ATPase [Desulfovibrio sp.]